MAIFEFRRHSIKDGVPKGTLGPNGLLLAARVGRELMRGKEFDLFCISSYERTRETLAAFADGAQWHDVERRTTFAPICLDWPELRHLWDVCHEAEKSGADMMQTALGHDAMMLAALGHDARSAQNAATSIAALFRAWVLTLKDDARVLVIGHSPYMELLVLGLTTDVSPGLPPIVLPGLKECQGFRIHTRIIGTDVVSVIEHRGRDLDPSDIRNELFGGSVCTASNVVRR
jgi:phosphohistidine phosphatase SixA